MKILGKFVKYNYSLYFECSEEYIGFTMFIFKKIFLKTIIWVRVGIFKKRFLIGKFPN